MWRPSSIARLSRSSSSLLYVSRGGDTHRVGTRIHHSHCQSVSVNGKPSVSVSPSASASMFAEEERPACRGRSSSVSSFA